MAQEQKKEEVLACFATIRGVTERETQDNGTASEEVPEKSREVHNHRRND